MAKAKKFASMELTNAKGKAIETRGIDATGETVKVSVDGKDVSVAIPEAVTDYVMLSEQEKSLKEKKDRAAEAIRAFVKEVREFFAARKDFTKTYRVFGAKTSDLQYAVDVSSTDKCSAPTKKEDLAAFKKELTAGVFNQIFEEVTVISIKKTVTDDDKKRRELTKLLIDTLGEDKVKEYFEKDTTYEVKPGLAKKIYDFSEEQRTKILDKIKFAADAVKDASTVLTED